MDSRSIDALNEKNFASLARMSHSLSISTQVIAFTDSSQYFQKGGFVLLYFCFQFSFIASNWGFNKTPLRDKAVLCIVLYHSLDSTTVFAEHSIV